MGTVTKSVTCGGVKKKRDALFLPLCARGHRHHSYLFRCCCVCVSLWSPRLDSSNGASGTPFSGSSLPLFSLFRS